MLNKDEYNQDQYNDYYEQETRGAEISGGEEEEGSGKKIALIFLLLLLISALGYFGWKSLNNTVSKEAPDAPLETASNPNETTTSEPVADVEKPETAIVADQAPTEANKIAKEIENIASIDSNSGKMSSDDIANIVQMVMMKMNQEKNTNTSNKTKSSTTTIPNAQSKQENQQTSELVSSLSGSEVDSLSSISDDVESISKSDNKKQASSTKSADTYNKVVLNSTTGSNSDALSQLSDEISSVIDAEESSPSSKSSYTSSITKEVKTRVKEMRYIVVKPGDTLGKIAKRAYGHAMDYKKIYQANPDVLRRPDRIYVGQKLRIP
jgi:nucleoid-associated protein YgaU